MNGRLRRLTLSCQGLNNTASFGRGLNGAAGAIERLGFLQIDTVSVVERAHHHILWSRVPNYHPDMLNRLVAEGRIFEYWSHAASYLPIRDYRFSLARMETVRAGKNRYYSSADPKIMRFVLDRIRDEGPLPMRAFQDRDRPIGGSWSWGPVRRAFDRLFMQGSLMVVKRRGMEKLFDLTERALPADVDTAMPSHQEIAVHLIDRAIAAYGVVGRDQLIHSKPGAAVVREIDNQLKTRVADGALTDMDREDGSSWFIPSELLDRRVQTGRRIVRLLSPFDNAIIHRDRLARLFNFHYRLECYVPAAKRKFGYFSLPILYRGAFSGSIDCKADRSQGKLQIMHLHVEDSAAREDSFFPDLARALADFSRFNQCQRVEIKGSASGMTYGQELHSALR